mmetsp:Transcript_74078/g.204423  ORF Transcript_74078/g.204423 Transcript_74078/m.204423 type:complete len:230 (+) Transcript_74078:757-1446(+)
MCSAGVLRRGRSDLRQRRVGSAGWRRGGAGRTALGLAAALQSPWSPSRHRRAAGSHSGGAGRQLALAGVCAASKQGAVGAANGDRGACPRPGGVHQAIWVLRGCWRRVTRLGPQLRAGPGIQCRPICVGQDPGCGGSQGNAAVRARRPVPAPVQFGAARPSSSGGPASALGISCPAIASRGRVVAAPPPRSPPQPCQGLSSLPGAGRGGHLGSLGPPGATVLPHEGRLR